MKVHQKEKSYHYFNERELDERVLKELEKRFRDHGIINNLILCIRKGDAEWYRRSLADIMMDYAGAAVWEETYDAVRKKKGDRKGENQANAALENFVRNYL